MFLVNHLKEKYMRENKMKADKFFDKLKDKEGISIYHRKFDNKDKQQKY